MSKTLSNRAHVTDTSLAFAEKNTSACIQGIRDGNFGGMEGGGRKIGSLSGIFGFVGILKALEYTET